MPPLSPVTNRAADDTNEERRGMNTVATGRGHEDDRP